MILGILQEGKADVKIFSVCLCVHIPHCTCWLVWGRLSLHLATVRSGQSTQADPVLSSLCVLIHFSDYDASVPVLCSNLQEAGLAHDGIPGF